MTSHIQRNDLFWVTCIVTIEYDTIELMATDEQDACDQAEILHRCNPGVFHGSITVKTSFEGEHAPVDEGA